MISISFHLVGYTSSFLYETCEPNISVLCPNASIVWAFKTEICFYYQGWMIQHFSSFSFHIFSSWEKHQQLISSFECIQLLVFAACWLDREFLCHIIKRFGFKPCGPANEGFEGTQYCTLVPTTLLYLFCCCGQ